MSYKHTIESVAGQSGEYTELRAIFERAISKTVNDGLYDLRRRSRGGFTYAALDAMGNPYGYKNTGSLASLGLISRHYNDRKKSNLGSYPHMYDSWIVKQSGENARISNTAPQASFVLEGTSKMLPRGGTGGFMDKVEADMYNRFEKNFANEVRRAK